MDTQQNSPRVVLTRNRRHKFTPFVWEPQQSEVMSCYIILYRYLLCLMRGKRSLCYVCRSNVTTEFDVRVRSCRVVLFFMRWNALAKELPVCTLETCWLKFGLNLVHKAMAALDVSTKKFDRSMINILLNVYQILFQSILFLLYFFLFGHNYYTTYAQHFAAQSSSFFRLKWHELFNC